MVAEGASRGKMMKKVSLSQLLSRSPRHGGGRRASSSANGEVLEALVGGGRASSTPHNPDKAPKKKGKGGGILQTLKKKISGKLDACQAAHCSASPRKSKSFEGLSNSFGDSFSQSVSEESSSDGLNGSGANTHKGKHNKRAIRPMHTPVARQNSSSRVLSDGEAGGGRGVVGGAPDAVRAADKPVVDAEQPAAALCLYSTPAAPATHISRSPEGPPPADAPKDAAPRVLVEAAEECQDQGCGEGQEHGPAATEASSPAAYGELWGPREAALDASKRSLAEELFRLARFGWYWGPISRAEAEEKLIDQPDGAFLVRDSSDDKYLLSLSFRSYNKTLHTRIEHSNGWFSFYPHPEHEGHTSLVGLIDHCMSHSESGVFCYSRARVPGSPSFPVRLTKPVSRFTQVRSLQYLCRFVIRQYTRVDHIQALPLPTSIKVYLEEGHY